MATQAEKIEQVRSAWKIALGVFGTLGGVAIILVLIAILLKIAFVKPTVAGGLTSDQRYALLAKARADDQKLLTTYGWIDKSKGIVRLPVDVAMQKLIEERTKQQ